MPTYEYACRKCGEHLEVVQSFTDEPLTKCPKCKGALRKVFGSIGVTFKGSGFYKTDNRPTSGKPKVPKEGGGDVAASTSSSSSSSSSSDGGSGSSSSESSKTDTKKTDTKKSEAKTA